MKKVSYPELRDSCAYFGSEARLLKAIGNYHRSEPDIQQLENCLRIQCEAGEWLYWWPETGDITVVEDRCCLPDKTSDFDWRNARKEEPRNNERWTRFDTNNHRNVSLPYLLIADPNCFFEEFALACANRKPPSWTELAELMDKSAAIRVPGLRDGKQVVEHRFGPAGRFIELAIGSPRRKPETARMNIIQRNWIDLSAGAGNRDWSHCPEPRFPEAVRCMLQLTQDGGRKSWSRDECEKFFDDGRNFVRLTNPDVAPGWRHIPKGAATPSPHRRRGGGTSKSPSPGSPRKAANSGLL